MSSLQTTKTQCLSSFLLFLVLLFSFFPSFLSFLFFSYFFFLFLSVSFFSCLVFLVCLFHLVFCVFLFFSFYSFLFILAFPFFLPFLPLSLSFLSLFLAPLSFRLFSFISVSPSCFFSFCLARFHSSPPSRWGGVREGDGWRLLRSASLYALIARRQLWRFVVRGCGGRGSIG